ncbi:hypothetical protein I7I50_05235 [Histoplasma capsulatum G186AR]|uniref:Uncharacterized protein n=1 Tax=Ajellomyces capsulatus TaxID=5037 RepID=A0A8H7ZAY7_AJECA|nr:hypothetical protein I7I52_03494 [Histoplasma capsulatum]QSS75936.1 hypothetical protein I7I50_05235 [Histoplasma capsulatum G186AR]
MILLLRYEYQIFWQFVWENVSMAWKRVLYGAQVVTEYPRSWALLKMGVGQPSYGRIARPVLDHYRYE